MLLLKCLFGRFSLIVITVLSAHLHLVTGLYKDQVGKFDWRKQYIGIPKFVYHQRGIDNLIIGTQSNVIASLYGKDGSIVWRQLLPATCQLDHMSILKSSDEAHDFLVKTGCTDGTSHVWNPQSGLLVSDSRYKEFLEDDQAESVKADLGHLVQNSRAFSLSESISLIVDQDGTVTYQAHQRAIWSREESLASVVAVEFVTLPIDMRDSFGLKKMIVLATNTGKFFGIDTLTGEVVWSLFNQDFAINTSRNQESVELLLTKQSDEDASESRAVAIHSSGVVISFNPITGDLVEKKKILNSIRQIARTEILTEEQGRGVIILDAQDRVHIYPERLVEQVKTDIGKYYITVVEQSPPILNGYKLSASANSIVPEQVWTLPLPESEKIVHLGVKRIDEETHSPARVLGDRGILYKYVNPNLIAIMTEGTSGDACQPEQSINIYLVDGVTGALIHSKHHPKSRGPSKMVHTENWIVYSYFNAKSRRTEISSFEMFEGTQQVNSSAFSSLTRSHIKPKLIEHKSFIFPSGINAMVDTVTLRGMTNKHVIVALPSGGLLEIPKIFLDSRRPLVMLPEHREEGLVPYMPELPIPSESMLNYDQTLLAVRRIVTSPAILESTSLVFAYGLDLFFTRVRPSKGFDILKDDFDHLFIAAVLIFFVVASLVSKYLAQRKALYAAWK